MDRLDRTAPTVTAPTAGARAGGVLGFAADDQGSGVASITVTPLRDGAAGTPIVLAGDARLFAAPATPGTYEFDVRVVDGVGHATQRRSDPIAITAAPDGHEQPPADPGPGQQPPDSGQTIEPTSPTPPVVTPTSPTPLQVISPAKLKRAALAKKTTLRLIGLRPHSTVKLQVRFKSKTITTLKATATADGKATLTLKLSARQRAAVRRASSLTLRFAVVSAGGGRRTITKTLRIG